MAGNWKMNLNHQEAMVLVQKLAWTLADKKHDYDQVEVVVLPPFTDLRSVQTLVDGDRLAHPVRRAGRLDARRRRLHRRDLRPAMLAKLGCTYVVVGHSERREYHAETDEVVNAKVHKALAGRHDPDPVRRARGSRSGRRASRSRYTLAQLDGRWPGFTAEQVAGLVVAYEPVWAIGTGEVATPEDAQEVCAAIRERIRRDRTATPPRTPCASSTAAR